ncbi:DNA methyltransferase [Natrarchaeobaculum sulfurireducens]|uniref:Type II methyltransferase n=1 Tax=Natrarchaeobaculum sulfurireducens TaxID=2044521 RepID=A0A346PSK6_9EURY|nr:DNA methyltransferase [Natrarchaeobaculum sulfurireducens]AXR77557.1 DNA modification methylase [Natrarchaeobaculum sulfurireducens]AXR82501.1 type II DNA modification methyltransferase [Natrarchaeobaculum sulfurireducens]
MADDGDGHRQGRLFTDEDGGFDVDRAREESLPVEDGEVIDTSDLADHQRYVEGRGIYDERNRVNDLTGKEWKYATKSVIAESYPPDVQHELRSEHGGQKPPRLCAELIGRFSKAGDTVLDPFAGVGGTLLGASFCEHEGTGLREAIGFERNDRWIEIYETVLERENAARADRGEPPLTAQELRHGDCADLIEDVPDHSVELLLTDVPYWNMDELEQTRNERATRESKLGAFDADREDVADGAESADGAALESADEPTTGTKDEWLSDMAEKFDRFADAVTPEGHVVVFIGDMYREQSYEFLSGDLARAIESTAPLTLAANLIWYDPTKDLHVYGYPFSFVPSMVHQNVLVFRLETEA